MSSNPCFGSNQLVSVSTAAATSAPARPPRPSSPALTLTDTLPLAGEHLPEEVSVLELCHKLEAKQTATNRSTVVRRVTPSRVEDPRMLTSHLGNVTGTARIQAYCDDGRCCFGPKGVCHVSFQLIDFKARVKLDRKWKRVMPCGTPPPYTRRDVLGPHF